MPTMLNSQTWPCFGCQIVPWIGIAVADLPAEPLREIHADDRALPIGQPRLHLSGGSLNSGYSAMNGSGSTAICAKKFDGS